MLKNFRDKIALSGITVLMIGVALLIFTFVSAYGFLTRSLSIIASADLVRTFGEAMAPLIETCIHIMYLGVMGWVGSLLTIRGVTIIAHAPKIPEVAPRKQVVAKPVPQKEKVKRPKEIKPQEPKAEQPKEEVKPPEPEIIVIPPEQVVQSQPPQEQKQENNASQPPPPQNQQQESNSPQQPDS